MGIALYAHAEHLIAALIGVGGVFIIMRCRNDIIQLTQEVEAYYHYEERLVENILILEKQIEKADPSLITYKKGRLRSIYIPSASYRPTLTARDAQKIRRRYLNFD